MTYYALYVFSPVVPKMWWREPGIDLHSAALVQLQTFLPPRPHHVRLTEETVVGRPSIYLDTGAILAMERTRATHQPISSVQDPSKTIKLSRSGTITIFTCVADPKLFTDPDPDQ